ncbi:MAG: hypothetical protein KGS48_13125 [Bacteroidetes bacterium]|nr:hypothetical protein [Bacteroidota bacterium]
MSLVKLQARHLWIDGSLAADLIGEAPCVYLVYYPERKALLLAPIDESYFTTVHKANQALVKLRNIKGDRSISLQELLIDHDIPDDDRPLPFLHQEGLRMLHITL